MSVNMKNIFQKLKSKRLTPPIAYSLDEYLKDNSVFACERKGGSVPKLHLLPQFSASRQICNHP